ncbi:MAG: glutamate-5-semialdehyde dehydrogenase [Candidatus Merdivicinus sp.]
MVGIEKLGQRAKDASRIIGRADTAQKNRCLEAIADAIWAERSAVLEANGADVAAGRENGLTDGLIDRLTLTEERIQGICEGVRKLVQLDDPVGIIESGTVRPNGLRIEKVRVPMGAVGIIYESRPNVTVDGATLCLKSGNAALLRGGKEAIHSNMALAGVMRQALERNGLPADCVQLVEDTTRDSAAQMMRLNGCLDLLIPRGGAGLIRSVVENATVPVIETGVGNCHIYVERTADLDMAVKIIVNAKTSRVSVCNAAESLLVDEAIAAEALPRIKKALDAYGVILYGCARTREILPEIECASEEDYGREYLDYKMSVKVVSSVDEAIAHINRYGTGHSEVIVTGSLKAASRFQQEVDAAAVYVNASSRFTDGGEFGFGAEIGISTQKLHARGPMGLSALTSYKYQIIGDGQVR